jgi:hypothetical protein
MDTQMQEASESSEVQRKRTRDQASGSRKKAKANKSPMETSLTKDKVELIATTVEDRLSEVWENAKNHIASILEQIQEVKIALEKLKVRMEKQQQKTTTLMKEGEPMGEIVHITTKGSVNFRITLDMLFMDEETTQRPLREIEMLDLALPKIPTKALYKLQVSIA